MKGDKERISPIMTNSESIWQFGNNAYGKPATALNILRETVMGRELFDYAFKTYAQRWMFKHPTPADLFRTMEDASAVDLDWFWRGWFFTNWHVDQGIKEIKWYQIDTQNPEVEKAFQKAQDESAPVNISTIRDDQEKLVEETWLERDPAAADFYNNFDPYKVTLLDMQDYERFVSSLDEDEKALLNSGMNYYEITFENVGELVMPIIVQFTYKDGSTEVHKIPVEIWKMNDKEVTKVFFSEKEVVEVALDPFLEIADTDVSNNYWPARVIPTRFELYKGRGWGGGGENPMQRQRRADELEGGE
tara:strand:- start:170 stop:1081 length:912 start_codon:yes stop_codon:yes gene_type:complete